MRIAFAPDDSFYIPWRLGLTIVAVGVSCRALLTLFAATFALWEDCGTVAEPSNPEVGYGR
jgi:hypothetical protein